MCGFCAFVKLLWIWTWERMYQQFTQFLELQYYGEKTAMYFAWATYYTASLFWIAIPGIGIFIRQVYNEMLDNEIFPFYCLYLSLWITIVNSLWIRYQKDLANKLKLAKYQTQADERDEFIYEKSFDPELHKVRHTNFYWSGFRKYAFTISLVVIGTGLIATFTVLLRWFNETHDSLGINVAVGIMFGVTISILKYLYYYLAKFTTDYENHRYKTKWENSFIFKIYGFEFINSYFSCFVCAFYDMDLSGLLVNMTSIFFTGQIIAFFINLLVPYAQNYRIQKSFAGTENKTKFETDYYLKLHLLILHIATAILLSK